MPRTPIEPPGTRPRIAALDVLRGFALCGITLANVVPIASSAIPGGPAVVGPVAGDADWIHLLVDHRFFPIFSFLFGVGFSIVLESAAARSPRPRLVLLRRLAALLVIGAAHHLLLWPGDILAVYAIAGLVVLLPSTWLPRWATAALAAALLVVAILDAGGRFMIVPGLFLLGSALARYGVVRRIEDSTRVPAALGLVLAACAVPAVQVQARFEAAGDIDALGHRIAYPLAGLLLAGAYVCLLLVLLRTPLRPVLQAMLAPLGRMALTHYLGTSVAVLALAHLVGLAEPWSSREALGIAGAIIAAQWVFSTLWFRRFRYGPAEWLWRWATWLRRPSLRRPPLRRPPLRRPPLRRAHDAPRSLVA
ncbi:DUF418 domain-containing protein [Myceligenerans pegani]|uniref:DUF418 domain-containing protein n=1 Tax=Myceligenerans pegani TaxID=2776917 RepID=A0ABR9MVW9_9MICO|nr:DUF418 domain-containing protein [Myceligenerans sp. TRM 65318]MBE1875533.1 DUF418 domain-containing protein [Myceligenerans sp. TRM 65318]MBE3017804.1 DUF418 domain-containing protein [Myceligenerans sp. TRM 65318]